MVSGNDKRSKKVKNLLAVYNTIPNVVWSVLNLTPISIFCFTLIDIKTVYIFLAISLIPIFLKNSFLNKIQIGKTTAVYKKLGVHFINKVAQNGVIINTLVKKKFPGYKVVTNRKSSIAGLISQTYVFEKFHLIFFLFFDLVIVYAITKGKFLWACIVLITNIAYNVYPNFLQQYIRIKLVLFNAKVKMQA